MKLLSCLAKLLTAWMLPGLHASRDPMHMWSDQLSMQERRYVAAHQKHVRQGSASYWEHISSCTHASMQAPCSHCYEVFEPV